MNHPEILYISFFDFQDSKVQRAYVTACTNKMESICVALEDAGFAVRIVSMANVIEPKFKVYKGETIVKNENLRLKLFFSWGGKSRLLRQIRMIWHLVALFFYLLVHASKDTPVIVYHSLGYFNVILWAKKIKRFKLILEVEEIYQDVAEPKFKRMARYENKMIKAADAYIFPTELLNEKLNKRNKPYAIIYGTYKVEPQITGKFNDGKIHVVYAGTFDPRKGGAFAAATAEYLSENYHVHICGFGNNEDTENLKGKISDIAEKSPATITFEGLKKGQEYIAFLQKCHIGLSTQDPAAAFNSTSFPSKILSYMANGLNVVTIDIPAVKESAVGDSLHYYKEQTPQGIANAIINIDNLENDNRTIISNLYTHFVEDVKSLVNSFLC